MDLTIKEIARRLDRFHQQHGKTPHPEFPYLSEFIPETPRPAAVLIPLIQNEGTWHILFTRRNANLPEHSGQVAFPGGRADPSDASPEETALREAWEEIGLDPADVNILGHLSKFITVTNYLVTPIVGTSPWPYPFQLATNEVSRIFTIPLDWLADPQNHEIRERNLPHPYQPVQIIYFKEYDGEMLWGVSARFIVELLDVLDLM
jgi:8-oxo-dGTP pyrophosphatase MutT (NUDIX family)